jgi:hypothetical protein
MTIFLRNWEFGEQGWGNISTYSIANRSTTEESVWTVSGISTPTYALGNKIVIYWDSSLSCRKEILSFWSLGMIREFNLKDNCMIACKYEIIKIPVIWNSEKLEVWTAG